MKWVFGDIKELLCFLDVLIFCGDVFKEFLSFRDTYQYLYIKEYDKICFKKESSVLKY